MARYSDDFRAELKKGFLEAVGNMADYRIRINAGGWVDKDVLTEEDFLEICDAINNQYIEEPPVIEEPIEDIPTEEVEEETEIEDETILDGEEESQTETEIPDDSTNEEVVEESVEETPEVEPTEPTE